MPALGFGDYGSPFLAVGVGVGLGLGDINGPGFTGGGRGFYNTVGVVRGPYVLTTPADFGADIHAVAGLGWSFKDAPFDLFVDFSPGILIVPELNLGARMTMGGRWYL